MRALTKTTSREQTKFKKNARLVSKLFNVVRIRESVSSQNYARFCDLRVRARVYRSDATTHKGI
jgi:hypothetical protein